MSERYIITSDNTADLPDSFLERNTLPMVHLSFTIHGTDYDDIVHKLEPAEFYRLMRTGDMTKTTQVNPDSARLMLEPLLKQGYDVLHIAFSSGLSGTFNSMQVAAEELREEYPARQICIVDTLAASLGEGLLVYYALKMKNEGKSFKEVHSWLEDNKLHLCHYFTVDDLNFLFRGGRVSKTAAVMGTMLGIKPVLHMDNAGKLIPLTKVRGRKQSLTKLVDYMVESVGTYKNEIVCISHGDCAQDAQFVADLIQERLGIHQFMMNYVGPTIGAHSGPGTVALFFLGTKR